MICPHCNLLLPVPSLQSQWPAQVRGSFQPGRRIQAEATVKDRLWASMLETAAEMMFAKRESLMMKLTDWKTGTPLLLNAGDIRRVHELEASPPNRTLGWDPIAKRTQILMNDGDILLVRESSARVAEIIEEGIASLYAATKPSPPQTMAIQNTPPLPAS